MRPIRQNTRLPIAAVLGAALAATALVGTARAGDSDEPIDQQILHKIMTGIGLQDPNAVQPTYEERPPLVIPNGDTLPPPQKAGKAIANNPAWPKDPDIERAKRRAEQEKHRNLEAEYERDQNPLPPNELGPKYQSRGRVADNASDKSADSYSWRGNTKMTPSQLGYTGGLFSHMFGSGKDDQEAARFTGEPARTSLTEPPPGYQTPSPDQPYGLGQQDTAPKADNSYVTRNEVHPNQ